MLKLSRLSVCLEYVRPENLDKTSSDQFIVDRFDDQPADILKALFRLQLKGSLVLSRLAWCEVVLQRFPSELLSLEDILSGRFFVARGTFQARLKRIGDMVVSAALLIITSPVVLISGILIKLSDRGPVFYSQVRTGLDGTPFRIWKLRTKRTDAEHQECNGHRDQTLALPRWVPCSGSRGLMSCPSCGVF